MRLFIFDFCYTYFVSILPQIITFDTMCAELFIRKLILFSLFIQLPLSIFAQSPQNDQTVEQQVISSLTAKYPQVKNNAQLKIVLAKELQALQVKTPKVAEIIANVFIANKNAKLTDELNTTSTALFKKALVSAKQINRKDLELWVTLQYGFYLYSYRKYESSFPLFMSVIKYIDERAVKRIIQTSETYTKTAYFLMTAGDYPKANEYFLIAKKYTDPKGKELSSITDNLGVVSIRQGNLAKAEQYFRETLAIASASKDSLRYAKALGNMAELKLNQKKYDTAIVLLNQDLAISKRLKHTPNSIYALVLLGKVYLEKGDLKAANQHLQLARVDAQTKSYLKSSAYEINSLILAIAKQTGNAIEELAARRNLEVLQNELVHFDGREAIMKVGWQVEKTKLELSIQEEKAEREKETLIKIITLVGCLFLILLVVFVIRYYQQQIKNEKAVYDKKILNIMLDKVNSEQKLNANHQTLTAYKTYLADKNIQIEELEMEIAKIKNSSATYLAGYSSQMQDLLTSHLMDNKSWKNFKKLFTETYPDYYDFLSLNFPKLTDSHLRIVFLSKLEMSNAEIARILGLTLDGVKKAKQRLRKKYNDKYDQLFSQETI
jgi:tetratricopeptide (TPR) repeat protein